MIWKELLVPKLSRRTLGARIWTGLLWAVYLTILAILFTLFAFDSENYNSDEGYHNGIAILKAFPGWLNDKFRGLEGAVDLPAADMMTFLVLVGLGFLIFRGARPARKSGADVRT